MNNSSLFKFNEKDVRVIFVESEPWFVLRDVCSVLGDLAPRVTKQRLSKDVCSTYPLQTSGGIQNSTIINEDGLYDVIFDSKKPEAKLFRKWVTGEVLPTIRRDGLYVSDEATHEQVKFNVSNFMANLDDYNITKLYSLIEDFLAFHRQHKTRLPYKRKNSKHHGNKKLKDHIESMEDIRNELISFLDVKIQQFNDYHQAGLAQEYVRIKGMVEWKVENMRYRTAACR
ncbi:Bro-N domain-containing protein [Paenibacillus polysaccharolyticus]|uniref:BRO-N domain-containing protein n=1 Tax=Paenibacillus polysaccharolyticus TaxID=582692 RepID=UPI003009F40D